MSPFSTLDTLEYPLVKNIHSFGTGTFIDSLSEDISNVPFMLVLFTGIIAILYIRKHFFWKPLLVALFVALVAHFLINEGVFKTLLVYFDIFRPRPYTLHSDLVPIGYAFHDSSFPSSHMAFTTLMVVILSYFSRSFIFPGIVVILCMGLSRVHNGMHYPSDVLIGTLMGTIYGFLGIFLMKKLGFEKQSWYKRIISHIF